jgi:hypothetical protein
VPRIDDRDDAVEAEAFGQFASAECLDNGAGISKARGFNQHVIESFLPLQEIAETFDQVAAHAAAKAAVVQFENFLIHPNNQLVIDIDGAEFVDDHCALVTMRAGEDAIQQRRFAGAEKAGEDRHRDHLFQCHTMDFATTRRGAREISSQEIESLPALMDWRSD